ncbi:hypothetical protein [Tropicibacter sp. Alg240-R139]|uniref:hypothetical protein n=1 Tax=Tropicibacter sp. Alg240-R139 TaxID=2305991 RepID=UPI0013DF3FCD|nr:hypothetical protein [Tropicibacter sp. Alg240-R139]
MSWLSTLLGVFYVGHSLFGPTNPQMMAQVLDRAAPQAQVDYQIINGAPLSYNWTNANRAEGLNARQALADGDYNVVILTEAIPLANQVEFNDSEGYAQKYFELATGANPETRVFLQETWHDLRSGSGTDIQHDDGDDTPWLLRIEQDLPVWEGIVEAVNAERSPDVQPMQLIPAGQAMALLADEITAGAVPGVDRIDDVFSDTIHPNDLGFYFLTMVQYAAVTGESPLGLPRRLRDKWGGSFEAPNPALAQRLQQIAFEAVAAYDAIRPSPPKPGAAQPAQAGTPPAPAAPEAPVETATTTEPVPLPEGFAPPPQPEGRVPMAIGLAGVNDWSVQQPFLDVMKTARPWIGHLPRQFGGATHEDLQAAGYLDDYGWPVEIPPELGSIGTLILTDLPPEAVSTKGRYALRYQGKGIVEVGGRAKNVRYGKNRIEFDFEPGPGPVDIRIQRTHLGGDYIRNISVVKLDHEAAYEAGAIFNPLWLDHLQGFQVLRFMDWMETNNSSQSAWADRPRPSDYTYASHGVPLEVMVELLNRTGADGWFNMPHKADDAYMRTFAEYVRDTLWVEQRAYVEYSNEVWNWQFKQAHWADEQALEAWGKKDHWVAYYGGRAAEMAQIWTDVYGDQVDERLVRVIATQTGWIGLEELILEAPPWVADKPDRKRPADYFDAYAVTGYFGGVLGLEDRHDMVQGWLAESRAQARQQGSEKGLTGEALQEYVIKHRFDAASAQAWAELRDGLVSGQTEDTLAHNLTERLPYHAQVAETYGLELIMYEGGTHVVGIGPMVDDEELTAFFTHFNYSPEMGALYTELIRGWHALGGKLFNAYADVYRPNKWGSWGHLRHLSDTNPRWQAVSAFR